MKKDIYNKIEELFDLWKDGKLGGESMPEDSNPHLIPSSNENYLYFTLPMALNYQRNSYTLWESALKTYEDVETRFLFNPQEVVCKNFGEVQSALVKYKLAIQMNKQTDIWIKISKTIVEDFDGDIQNLFILNNYDVEKIKEFIQLKNKKKFPYLSGKKLCNYWLFVLYQYTDIKLKNIDKIDIATDTHIIKSTHRLGLIDNNQLNDSKVQDIVIKTWRQVLEGSKYTPIEIQTPLWLWSRGGFKHLL